MRRKESRTKNMRFKEKTICIFKSNDVQINKSLFSFLFWYSFCRLIFSSSFCKIQYYGFYILLLLTRSNGFVFGKIQDNWFNWPVSYCILLWLFLFQVIHFERYCTTIDNNYTKLILFQLLYGFDELPIRRNLFV